MFVVCQAEKILSGNTSVFEGKKPLKWLQIFMFY